MFILKTKNGGKTQTTQNCKSIDNSNAEMRMSSFRMELDARASVQYSLPAAIENTFPMAHGGIAFKPKTI